MRESLVLRTCCGLGIACALLFALLRLSVMVTFELLDKDRKPIPETLLEIDLDHLPGVGEILFLQGFELGLVEGEPTSFMVQSVDHILKNRKLIAHITARQISADAESLSAARTALLEELGWLHSGKFLK